MLENIPTASLTQQQQVELRFAMLSVYYHSLGRQLELRGAPSVLLPSPVRPLELAEALDILSASPPDLRDALWRVVRSIPVGFTGDSDRLYPPELDPYIKPHGFRELTKLRRANRNGSNVFAAALSSARSGNRKEYRELQQLLRSQYPAEETNCSSAIGSLVGESVPDFLDRLIATDDEGAGPEKQSRGSQQLKRLEDEVDTRLSDFVDDMADAAAFHTFAATNLEQRALGGSATVFPVSSVVRQDSRTLTTASTVTSLVQSDFAALSTAVDPQSWSWSSDVVQKAGYVTGPFDLTPSADPPELGSTFRSRLVEEQAGLSWGRDASQQGTFHNLLNVSQSVHPDTSITVRFSLCRSVSSRVLWDERVGGIRLDQGFIKVRPLGPELWRVTRRKVLNFSDRTPYSNGPGWLDFGNMLNYLAPTALTWWVESELYGLAGAPGNFRGRQPPASGEETVMSIGEHP
jgi:hypothetical protein